MHLAQQESFLSFVSLPIDTLIHLIEQGFPFTMLKALSSRIRMPISEVASILKISERTLARRRVAGRLTPEESERLLRIATMFEKIVKLFEGETASAVAWLKTPKKVLANQSPLQYGYFEAGAREVENLIGRLEHGIF